jgi:hypothetical protein
VPTGCRCGENRGRRCDGDGPRRPTRRALAKVAGTNGHAEDYDDDYDDDNWADQPWESDRELVATVKGSMAHRPDCVVVAGKPGLRAVDASEGLLPCKLCDPYAMDDGGQLLS